MSLLREIQEDITDPEKGLGAILLKVRLLADRLGSEQLEEWVKYESEGYPKDGDVPEYRVIELSYTGNFHNTAWQANQQPIPPYLIEKYCGKQWTQYKVRESISSIEGLRQKMDSGGHYGIDASNLILMLQGKIFKDMNCSSIDARFSEVALLEIQNIVRARVLELTMKIAKEIPGAEEVSISKGLTPDSAVAERVSQVFHTTVHGPHTVVTSSGSNNEISIQNISGNLHSLKNELVKAGIPENEAAEFSKLLSEEKPDENQSLGDNAIAWIASKLPTIGKGAWGITSSVATSVLEEAAKRFYGLS